MTPSPDSVQTPPRLRFLLSAKTARRRAVAPWAAACALSAALGCGGEIGSPAAGGPDNSTGTGGSATPGMPGSQGQPPVDADGKPLEYNADGVLIDGDGNPLEYNADGVLVDGDGNPVTDADGNPITANQNNPAPDNQDMGGTPSNPITAPGELANCSTPGPRQVRRLTTEQYARTVRAIFNDPNVAVDSGLSDASAEGFKVDSQTSVVRDLEGELLMNYAESVADWAVQNSKLGQFTTCTEQREDCYRAFVANFGLKAQREPLSETNLAAYVALFDQEETFEDGMRAVVGAMLQSPFTLYRRELGTNQGGQFALTPYELASQLSYWLTNSPPDAALFDAAANGRLSTQEDLTREAARLLDTEGARETLAAFLEGWLHLDKLPSKAKDEALFSFPVELRQSMMRESTELFVNTFYENGSLADLFTASHTYVDQSLGSFYGLNAGGQGFQRTELSGSNRPAGVLGQAAFLSTHALSDNSSPVQRGKVVIERLLCGTLPPVPMGIDTSLEPQTDFSTNRERYEVHRERDECRNCHENLDPIGFAFEHFDAFGRYRAQENGIDIDASGSLNLLASGPVPLDGVDTLSRALAESPELQSCFVRYWSYYTFGAEHWSNEECHQDGIIRAAQADGFTLRGVLMSIVESPHFSQRVADQ